MRGAHPERDLESAIERSGLFRAGERVLVGCSGGPDSSALAAALHAVAGRLRIETRLAHVNHGIRVSAWQDECIALALSARLGVPIDVLALDALGKDEASLRDARYAALAATAKRNDCSVVATAHHAQDQSETVLLALLRGSGPVGLSGMPARRALAPGIDLVRPLLGVEPETLRAYCHATMLPYGIDPTNAGAQRRRNAVREALAALRPHFPGLDRAVARAAEVLAGEHGRSSRAQLRRSVRERFAADDELRDVDFGHVEAAVRALESGRSGTYLMKPGFSLRIERGAMMGIIAGKRPPRNPPS